MLVMLILVCEKLQVLIDVSVKPGKRSNSTKSCLWKLMLVIDASVVHPICPSINHIKYTNTKVMKNGNLAMLHDLKLSAIKDENRIPIAYRIVKIRLSVSFPSHFGNCSVNGLVVSAIHSVWEVQSLNL